MIISQHAHRRYNALTGEWLLVSPHRALRPWQGQVEKGAPETRPAYDPTCYLCPGNVRANGQYNPAYTSTFVFDNDFSALLPDTPEGGLDEDGLLVARSDRGICRVVCFSPRHDLTLPELTAPDIETVVATWIAQTRELGALPFVNYVQVFENKGAIMGCSNPHPHGQIWASQQLPTEPAKEGACQQAYRELRGTCLLCDYLALERTRGERIVCAEEYFTALVPFWAVWPFETMVLAHRHAAALDELDGAEQASLARLLKRLTTRYDNLFQVSFPYSMGFHGQPSDGQPHPEWHLHAHFYPPLLRSATVKKFMVGYEMLASPQRDITAERSAARLRELPETREF